MATVSVPVSVPVPRIEDEIEQAWQELVRQGCAGSGDADHRALFEAGFRAARTVRVKVT